jgi:hypothetical protein
MRDNRSHLKNAILPNFFVRAEKLILEIYKCLSKIPPEGGAVTFSALPPRAGLAART